MPIRTSRSLPCPTRRRIVLGAPALALSAALPLSGFAQELELKKQFLSLGTSASGGTWMSLGALFADIVRREYPALSITAESTGGSVDNVNLLKNKQIELGLTTNAEAYQAMHAEGPFDEKITNFSALMRGGTNNWQTYTLEKTGIKSLRDLKGKRVSLGAAGSSSNLVGQAVIEAHGLKMGTDWKPEYLSHGSGPDALRDGTLDAVVIVSTTPTSALVDLTSSEGANVRFLNPEPEVLAKLKETFPYWSDWTLPGGVYNGHPDDIPGAFSYASILTALNSLPDDVVYAITKAILENPDRLEKAISVGKYWVLDTALDGIKGVLPVHPGAERYYKERGLL